MNIFKKLTYRNIKLNRKRTIVTIIGIILSVALISALSTLVISFKDSMIRDEYIRRGKYHIAVRGFSEERIKEVKQNKYVDDVYSYKTIGFAMLDGSKNEDKPYLSIIATDKNSMKSLYPELLEGRYPERDGEIIISRHIKTNGRVDIKVGDKLTLDVGQRVYSKVDDEDYYYNYGDVISLNVPYLTSEQEKLENTSKKSYVVVGIMERPAYYVEDYSAAGYSCVVYDEDVSTADTIFVRLNQKGLRNSNKAIATILDVDYDAYRSINNGHFDEEAYSKVYGKLESENVQYEENGGLLSLEATDRSDSFISTLIKISIFVAVIIVIASVFCIRNSFAISVTEKIGLFGMLASVGASKRQIKKSVLYEAFLLGLIGIPLGYLSGLFAASVLVWLSNYVLSDIIELHFILSFSWISLLVAGIIGIVTIYFSAIGSAIRASRINPIQAIRKQTEIKIKKSKLKTPKLISKIWGIGGNVSYKNMKRNKRKYRTTVLSIIICTIVFIVISYFMSIGFDLLRVRIGELDYSLRYSFSDSNDAQKAFSEMKLMDGYDEIVLEKDIRYSFQVQNMELEEDYLLAQYNNSGWSKGGNSFEDYIEYNKENGYLYNVDIIALNDEYYKKYLKELSVSEADGDGKCVLVNSTKTMVRDDKDNSANYREAIMDIFNVNGENTIELMSEKTFTIDIAKVTDVRPMGIKNTFSGAYLIISDEMLEDVILRSGIYDASSDKGIDYLYLDNIYIASEKADELQDEIEKMLIVSNISDDSYFCDNVLKHYRETKSIYMLFAVFAYGLIVVIALIGITNIVNTINTSMELRRSEFAMLRSVGMTKKEFNKMMRLETAFVSLKSLIIGVPIGLLCSYELYRIEAREGIIIKYHFPGMAVMIVIAASFVLLASIMNISLAKINKRNIIETIKNDNI